MGFFKSALRGALGTDSTSTVRMLEASRRVRFAFQDRLLDPPVPLLDPDRSLLVVWAAKSACSLTFVWYLKLVGLLDDYRASGCSPHEYRNLHYLQSDKFLRGRAKVLDDYRIVHVLRDPYLRAVSCYRHVLAYSFADKRFRTFRKGALDRRKGFSFSAYLDFLESLDLAQTNLHHRQQFHRIERIKPADRVINISKGTLFQELNRLEEEMGAPRTDFAALGWVLQREEDRKAKTTTFDREAIADRPFDAAAASGQAPWPDYEQFLSSQVRRRIERLYSTDFEVFSDYL